MKKVDEDFEESGDDEDESSSTKEEIEEAAKFLQNPEQIQNTQQSETPNTAIKPRSKKVSDYNTENPKSNLIKKTGKWLLTAIIIAAIIFVGLLIAFLVTT